MKKGTTKCDLNIVAKLLGFDGMDEKQVGVIVRVDPHTISKWKREKPLLKQLISDFQAKRFAELHVDVTIESEPIREPIKEPVKHALASSYRPLWATGEIDDPYLKVPRHLNILRRTI